MSAGAHKDQKKHQIPCTWRQMTISSGQMLWSWNTIFPRLAQREGLRKCIGVSRNCLKEPSISHRSRQQDH